MLCFFFFKKDLFILVLIGGHTRLCVSQGLPLILLRDPSRSALAHDQRTRGYSGSDSSPGRVGVADPRLVELCWPLGATFFFFCTSHFKTLPCGDE